MKKRLFWALWAILPVGVAAVHMGLGRDLSNHDRAAGHLRAALTAEQGEDWAGAAGEYAEALALMTNSPVGERRVIELARAKARMMAGEYIEGQEQLENLLADALADPQRDEPMIARLRADVASAAYYAAWSMRLEGATEDEWLPESELARQQYRLLTEQQAHNGSPSPASIEPDAFAKNLEAVVRFQRMTIEEVRAMGPPKKCNGNNLCNSKRKQRQSQGKKPGQPKDAREQIKSAGSSGNRGTGW
jgi:hypothetical protein